MIFVSHAWDNGQPDPRVLQFTDFLRKNGYDAECDVMYQQQKTAIHFMEMMASALGKSEKIIIILSENYRNKANNFQGGVGTEYRYIIEDFAQNENKYILVSFRGRTQNIVPDFLKGRDIVDLEEDAKGDYRGLFSKLAGVPKFEFSPVAPTKTVPVPQDVGNLPSNPSKSISSEIGLNFFQRKQLTDIDKKQFLKDAFDNIINMLKNLADEYCAKFPYCYIEIEEIDKRTFIFELYIEERKVQSVQIWVGNMFGSHENGIFLGNSLGEKNSFSEMLTCVEIDGKPILHFSFGITMRDNNVNLDEAVKQIWEKYLQIHLRRK